MPESHPDDRELFLYTARELDAAAEARVEAHLARCRGCGERVAALERGREELGYGGFEQLPPRRRDAFWGRQGPPLRAGQDPPLQQRGEAARSPAASPKRLLAVLTLVLAVVAVLVVLAGEAR